ncbi:hypothetical protein [uncultured Limosilactobacillus sp.]|uniref:hypothetical protein n=1 Tax=uncultured Limosilactobacillus sp. TaxID=2837629 RepID=UPI0025EF2D13|nr:hypothetical protein [uncultured Limosilactobacillus sp.]
MNKQKNVVHIIATTIVTMLIALVIELMMFYQHRISWMSSGALLTLMTILIVMIIVVLLAVGDWHFSNYGTIAAMMYYGIISLGGLLQVQHKASVAGLLTQLLAIIGIVLCVYGIVLGVRQRERLIEKKYREQRRSK